ncbi:MAG TPA: hypothetical protein VN174_02255 [Candidatus Methanoperedens sp.]|nr:hypothetical protein [Candidatus Methanoperedens sp.]
MKTLVVFYSRTGNTKKMGQLIAKKLDADLDEIIDNKNRKGILGFIFGGRDALREYLTDISFSKNPSNYDLVIVGTPVWAGSSTPAFRTYLTENKNIIKKAAVFVTSGGDTVAKTVTVFEKITGKNCLASVGWTNAEINQNNIDTKLNNFVNSF